MIELHSFVICSHRLDPDARVRQKSTKAAFIFSQDGRTGTRFTLLPETTKKVREKKTVYVENGSQDIGHQELNDSERQKTRWDPRLHPTLILLVWKEVQVSKTKEMASWRSGGQAKTWWSSWVEERAWKFGVTKVVVTAEYQRWESCSVETLQRASESVSHSIQLTTDYRDSCALSGLNLVQVKACRVCINNCYRLSLHWLVWWTKTDTHIVWDWMPPCTL